MPLCIFLPASIVLYLHNLLLDIIAVLQLLSCLELWEHGWKGFYVILTYYLLGELADKNRLSRYTAEGFLLIAMTALCCTVIYVCIYCFLG